MCEWDCNVGGGGGRFAGKEDVGTTNVLKSSTQRSVRKQILERCPAMSEEAMEVLIPKKSSLFLTKCRDNISFIVLDGVPLFFQHFDGPLIPTLRILHQYPSMLPHVQVDKGAIKYVLSGADIMCPGLTSAGGRISTDLLAGTVVAVMADGMEHALAIGIMKMSGTQM